VKLKIKVINKNSVALPLGEFLSLKLIFDAESYLTMINRKKKL